MWLVKLLGLAPPPPPPPPPPPQPVKVELETPWRKMPWGQKEALEKKVRNLSLRTTNVKYVRILIVGEVGVGKSSFINSVNNTFQGRITSGALAGTCGTSFTKAYKTHHVKGKDGSRLPFVFIDIMGLERIEQQGANVKDIISAMKGCLKEGYKFNPVNPAAKNDSDFINNPGLSEQCFCLVNVVDGNKLSLMDNEIIHKFQEIRKEASAYNLPQLVIMTKVDELCPLVKEDLRKVYTSIKIKQKIEACSNLLGIPINHIFPVKNYHMEIDPDENVDVLILKALDQMFHLAIDALEDQTDPQYTE